VSDVDPRLVAAIDHLQRAALELIAAARSALDVAEDLARDPAPLQAMVEGVLATFAPAKDEPDPEEPTDARPRARVQRIRVD